MKKAGHDLLVGRTIAGKYVVENLIGSGAMGAVFRARQVALEKTVAIKVMHGEHADDPAFAGRFHREAKAASRLNHPNSIQVLDFGAEPDGLLYIAMEYLDGRSLHHVLRDEWPLAPGRVADLLMQTLAALAVAHDMGIVHRDLKPENVMVLSGTDDDGRPKDIVKVCDFGIAKITDPRAYRGTGERDSEGPVTTAGFLVGTPEYMSPEQGRGEKLDPRSDLYSVGVILFEMLTKRVPFEAENAIGVVLKHITEEPPVPSRLVPGVDARLDAIALRALRKFREERYPSAREMRAELRVVAESSEASPVEQAAATPAASAARPVSFVTAATVAMPVPPVVAALSAAGPKPTLQGTTASVAGPPNRRRGVLLAGVILAALAAGATGTAVMLRRAPRTAHTSVTPLVTPAAATLVPLSTGGSIPPLAETAVADELTSRRPAGPHPSGPASASVRAKSAVPPAASAKPVASSPGEAPASASSSSPLPPNAASAPSLAAAVAPPLEVTPAPASAPTSSAEEGPTAADPDFDPDRAYVEVGMINAEGVKERAVRGALHGLGLSRCYKSALRARGAQSTGIATLNLSFDDSGLARSAILTGADFLPGLARCVQEMASGLRIGKAQVDGSGGVAEVTLGFREP
jgi:eukaryotic-like serine/threonine-protein kinase